MTFVLDAEGDALAADEAAREHPGRPRAAKPSDLARVLAAGRRSAWQLEDDLAAAYARHIAQAYKRAAKALPRIAKHSAAAGLSAALDPAERRRLQEASTRRTRAAARRAAARTPGSGGWSMPDQDELGVAIRQRMDEEWEKKQNGGTPEAIRIEAMRRATEAGLQLMHISFDVRNPLVEGVLSQLGTKITDIEATTRRDIMASLDSSWQNGDSIPRAAKKLRAASEQVSLARGRLIARTEILGAVNGGAHALGMLANDAFASAGEPPLLKIWLTAEDELVRDDHVEVGAEYGNGQGIPMDEPFQVGDDLMQYPGDPDGSAAEVCNCRCALSYEEAETVALEPVAPAAEEPAAPDAGAEALVEARTMADLAQEVNPGQFDTPAEARIRAETEMLNARDDARRDLASPESLAAERARYEAEDAAKPDHEKTAEEWDQIRAEAKALDEFVAYDPERAAAEHAELPPHQQSLPDDFGVTVLSHTPDWGDARARGMFQSQAVRDNGYQVYVKATSATGNTTRVFAQLSVPTPRGPEELGTIMRTIDGRARTVKHDYFFLQDEAQGKGIATDFLRSSIREYDRVGIETVNVHAAGVNGRYTWSRFGFDFDKRDTRENMRDHFHAHLARWVNAHPEMDVAAYRDDFIALQKQIESAEHTWDFANISSPLDREFGKHAMLSGPDWEGSLDLRVGSPGRKVFDAYTKKLPTLSERIESGDLPSMGGASDAPHTWGMPNPAADPELLASYEDGDFDLSLAPKLTQLGEQQGEALYNNGRITPEVTRRIDAAVEYSGVGHVWNTAMRELAKAGKHIPDDVSGNGLARGGVRRFMQMFENEGEHSVMPEDSLLMRGTTLRPEQIVGGMQIEDAGFVSTAADDGLVAKFATSEVTGGVPEGRVPIAVRLHAREGTKYISVNPQHAEIVLEPGTRYVLIARAEEAHQVPGIETWDAIVLRPGETGEDLMRELAPGPKLAAKPPAPEPAAESAATVRELGATLEAEFAGLTLDVSERGNVIKLSRIVVAGEHRGQGVGTAVMERLHAYADAHGKTVALSPSTDFGGGMVGLMRFYKRLGYVANKGANADYEISESMYRLPKPLTADATLGDDMTKRDDALKRMTATEDDVTVEQVLTPEQAAELKARLDAAAGITAAALPSIIPDDATPVADANARGWTSVLCLEGVPTSDGRMLGIDSVKYRELPLTLTAQLELADAHGGAIVAGRIDSIEKMPAEDAVTCGLLCEREGGYPPDAVAVVGEGVFDESALGDEVMRMVGDQVLRGISVDLAPERGEVLELPAAEGEEAGMLMEIMTEGSLMGATVCAHPAFAEASIRIGGGQQPIVAAMRARTPLEVVTSAQVMLDEPAAPLTASGAGLAPEHPPAEWFEQPELDGPTPITITDEGRIYGHLATWGTCHIGYPGECVEPPESLTDYALFHLGHVETAEGMLVPVGTLTLDTGHAGLTLGTTAARAHYDHTGTAAADVRCGEDAHGIWFAGAIRPELDARSVRALRAAKISGDWRPHDGTREMVAALAVNVPGFPVVRPRTAVAASGQLLGLVAAGVDLAPAAVPTRTRILELAERAKPGTLEARRDALAARARK